MALVLLVLLVGLPMAMSMGPMPPCPKCNLSPGEAWAMCLAVLSLISLVVPAPNRRVWAERSHLRLLLLAGRLERPPRFA